MPPAKITNLEKFFSTSAPPLGHSGKLAFSIAELAEASSVGRTGIYAAIKGGELRHRKVGRRTIILLEDARRWLAGEQADAG